MQASGETWGLGGIEELRKGWRVERDPRGAGLHLKEGSEEPPWLLGLSRAGLCVFALAPQTWALGSGDGSETRRPSSVCAED